MDGSSRATRGRGDSPSAASGDFLRRSQAAWSHPASKEEHMKSGMTLLSLSLSLPAAMIASLTPPALAAGPYDGTWQVDAAPAGGGGTNTTSRSDCEGLRLQFQVKDSQVKGSMARSVYGSGVTQGGRGATPVTGTVQPDGTFNAQWQSYKATGKLTGDKAEMSWKGQCGPRVATGGRVASEGAAGSSTK
jgi:hypothetical protein